MIRVFHEYRKTERRAVGVAFPLLVEEETQQKRTTLGKKSDESSCTRFLEDELALAGAERTVLSFPQVETDSPQGVKRWVGKTVRFFLSFFHRGDKMLPRFFLGTS